MRVMTNRDCSSVDLIEVQWVGNRKRNNEYY